MLFRSGVDGFGSALTDGAGVGSGAGAAFVGAGVGATEVADAVGDGSAEGDAELVGAGAGADGSGVGFWFSKLELSSPPVINTVADLTISVTDAAVDLTNFTTGSGPIPESAAALATAVAKSAI